MKRVLSITALLCAAALVVIANAQSFPLGLLPSSGSTDEPLEAYVWTMESRFEIGESIEIHLAASRDAFIYLFDLQPDGVVRMLFPNVYSASNYFSREVVLPDADYRLVAQPPTGIEELLVFASTRPLPIPLGSLADPFPVFATNPAEAIDQLVSLLAAIDGTTTWGVGWTALQIVGDPEPEFDPVGGTVFPAMPPLPTFPGTPGESWHWTEHGWAYGVPSSGWYWHYGIDHNWHLSWVWF